MVIPSRRQALPEVVLEPPVTTRGDDHDPPHSEWAGHNSVAFTLTRYGGLFEDGSDEAVDRLDALLSERPDRTNVRDMRRS